jgi:hypothetical protein
MKKARAAVPLFAALLSSCTQNLEERPSTESRDLTANTQQADDRSSLPLITTAPLYNLEMLGDTANPFAQANVRTSPSDPLKIAGWAVDAAARDVASGVDIVIDESRFPAEYPSNRADVAKYFNVPAYGRCGFSLEIPAGQLASGKHTLVVRIINRQRTGYYQGVPLTFYVR